MLRNTIISVSIALFLSACMSNDYRSFVRDNSDPINLMPMYGYPKVVKTEDQKKADKRFIESVVKESGSRRKSSDGFVAWGWEEHRKGNVDNAMRRFNQSWLLDQNYYQPYWGFGAILLSRKQPSDAVVHFERALKLIDNNNEKPRLLVDSARAYAWLASIKKDTDSSESRNLYNKANVLIEEALRINPKYGKAYLLGSLVYYDQGDYANSWRIIKKSLSYGNYNYGSDFIKKLSIKMAEPK